MRYSIRGEIETTNISPMVAILGKYPLWRLNTMTTAKTFEFSVWVGNVADKDSLFDEFKPHVDTYHGWIDWHECNHDKSQPCQVDETYRRG